MTIPGEGNLIGFCSCCRPLGRRGFLAAGSAAGLLSLAGCADSPTYNALAASVVSPEQEAELGLQRSGRSAPRCRP